MLKDKLSLCDTISTVPNIIIQFSICGIITSEMTQSAEESTRA